MSAVNFEVPHSIQVKRAGREAVAACTRALRAQLGHTDQKLVGEGFKRDGLSQRHSASCHGRGVLGEPGMVAESPGRESRILEFSRASVLPKWTILSARNGSLVGAPMRLVTTRDLCKSTSRGVTVATEKVFVNGKLSPKTDVYHAESPWELNTTDSRVAQLLLDAQLSDLQAQLTAFDILDPARAYQIPGLSHPGRQSVGVEFVPERRVTSIEISSDWSVAEWRDLFSMTAFRKRLKRLAPRYPSIEVQFGFEGALSDAILMCRSPLRRSDLTVRTAHTRAVRQLESLIQQTVDDLRPDVRSDPLTGSLTFPPEIEQAACQYLRYFGQFLADLGLDASVEVKQRTHDVLFTIIPASQGQALEKIREALGVYLSLPNCPAHVLKTLSACNRDLSVVQVLSLAEGLARVQAAQSHLVDASRVKKTGGSRLANDAPCASSDLLPVAATELAPEPERLLGQFVSVKNWAWGPFVIHAGTLLRVFKRLLRRGS